MPDLKASSSWAAALCCLPVAIYAHHARFEYDDSQLVEVRGTVTSIFWRNPHVRFALSGVGEDGDEELWEMEGGSVNTLQRQGIDSDIISVGDDIRVLGLISRRDDRSLLPIYLTLASGRDVVMLTDRARSFGLIEESTEPTLAAVDDEKIELAIRQASGIFRVWTNTHRSGGNSSLPLTEAALAAKQAWYQPTDDRALRCEPPGMPENMLSPYPIEFVDRGAELTLRLEEWDGLRVIHMGPAAEGGDPPATLMGYSVGRWEGQTLVVETTKLNSPYFDAVGTPHSASSKIIERFTLSEDASRLDWEATVIDPETFTEPVSPQKMHWAWVPGEEIKPFNCTVPDRG